MKNIKKEAQKEQKMFFKNAGVKITSKHHKKSKKMFCFQ